MGPARSAAPTEVAGDLDVVLAAYGQLFSGMEQAGYEASKVPLGAVQPLASSGFQASSGRLNSYVARACPASG
jgi:hypothetical protein